MRFLMVACGMIVMAGKVDGQSVSGRVIATTGEYVAVGSSVTALDSTGTIKARTQTDSLGQFAFRLDFRGTLTITLGEFAAGRAQVEVSPGDSLWVELRADPIAFALEPLEVRALRRGSPRLAEQGFYARRNMGSGLFLERLELERRGAVRMTEALRMLPGVRTTPVGGGRSWDVYFPRGGRGQCTPNVYLDGLLVRRGGRALRPEDASLDDIILVDDVEGVEIYRGAAETPVQYEGVGPNCGVVVIWSRRQNNR